MKKLLFSSLLLFLFACNDDVLLESETKTNSEVIGNSASVKSIFNDPHAILFLGYGYDPLKSIGYKTGILNDNENYQRNSDLGPTPSNTEILIVDTEEKLKQLTSLKTSVEVDGTNKELILESSLSKSISESTKIDKSHFLIVAKIDSKLYRFELVGEQYLSNNAASMLNSNTQNFIDNYGLMFVTDQTIGGTTYYYYQYEINNVMTSSSEEIKSEAKAGIANIFETSESSQSNPSEDNEYKELTEISNAVSSIAGFYPQKIKNSDEYNKELLRMQDYANDLNNIHKLGITNISYKPYSSIVTNNQLENQFIKRNNEINNFNEWSQLKDRITFIKSSSNNINLINSTTVALVQIVAHMNNAVNGTNSVAPSNNEYKSIFNQWSNENAPRDLAVFSSEVAYNRFEVEGKYGQHASGGGICLCDINGNGKLDIVTMQVDAPKKYNNSYISVGWDLTADGNPVRWTKFEDINAFQQKSNDGGDVTVADIDQNGKMDLIVFVIDDPSGYNNGYYKIGYDMNPHTGKPTRWSDKIKVNVNWNQTNNDGAGIIAKDIDGNGVIDFLIGYTDAPHGSNKGYYNIGWNIKSNGQATYWSNRKTIQGDFWTSNADCGVTIGDITGDGRNDLISFYIDNTSGTDKAYFRVGESLNKYGIVEGSWYGPYEYIGNYGTATDGTGISIGDINKDGKLDIITYYIDDSDKYNRGWCEVKLN